ncbi:MAG: 3'-5' exonuclease, partial [Desulfobacterales bacterium]|nr:3'-5' exonuclease [Desulfobacterales bacterium]
LVGLAEASEEPELRQLVRVVCDYGHQIPRLIEDICSRHTDVPKRAWADFDGIFFSTAHKAKGLEFEQVWLADDFMRFFENGCELRPDQVDQEEVNILYVALTRARAAIRLSESFDEWVRHRRLLPT